jgi:serine/threonine-protein kinase
VIGTSFADRYEILEQLGDGVAGEVWKARDTHQDQIVALKIFRPGLSTIHVYGEASILTALEGDQILRVYNADTFQDIPYIATKVAALGTAEGLLRSNRWGLPADVVRSWVRQVLVGLGACHDRQLLHRDIKPANMFLETTEIALLGDFGLAYQLDADGTAPADGSPHTIAPEMWESGRGTKASDIYSMGVSTYRLLTGRWPFDADSREELKRLAVEGRFVRLRDLAPQLSRRLADRVEAAMARDPAGRPAWREMHEALGQHGVVSRVWRRHSPHNGHEQCWDEIGPNSATRHAVCVFAKTAKLAGIEVRHADGAQHRITSKCRESVDRGRLGSSLRDVFDHL